jgi:hypothetical protein
MRLKFEAIWNLLFFWVCSSSRNQFLINLITTDIRCTLSSDVFPLKDSAVGIATGYRLGCLGTGVYRYWCPRSLFIRWLRGCSFPRAEWPGRETDGSLLPIAEVKNSGAIPYFPHITSWHGTYLVKYRDKLTFIYFKVYTQFILVWSELHQTEL